MMLLHEIKIYAIMGTSCQKGELSMRPNRKPIKGNIPINRLRGYTNHPRKTPSGAEFDVFCDDIKKNGIHTRIKARFTLGEINDSGEEVYEIISGHCRWEAAKVLKLDTIPAIIETVQDEDADKEVVSSNFGIKNMSPSEIGRFCKMWMDSHSKQGKHPSDGESDNDSNRDKLAKMFGLSSGIKVHRHIRFAHLIQDFQNAVDSKGILLSVAENISFLTNEEQKILHKIVFKKGVYALNRSQSTKLKKESVGASKAGSSLSENQIIEILGSVSDREDVLGTKKLTNIKVPYESIEKYISKYFEDQEMTEEGVQDFIMKALEAYEPG